MNSTVYVGNSGTGDYDDYEEIVFSMFSGRKFYAENLKSEDFWKIARRYFVLNGFDGILTVLGITAGSFSTQVGDPKVLITSCLGSAIALGVSGISGAYITEKAEHLKEFKELQSTMLSDLKDSVHKKNVTQRSVAISIVNGASPFLNALLSTIPYFRLLV